MIFDTKKSKSYVLGYDLNDSFSQISFLASDADMPETLSVLAGAELYNIPTVLAKQRGASFWYYGKEAVTHISAGDGIPVDHLIERARKGTPVVIEAVSYDPVALLALFIKRSLSLLSMEMSMDLVKTIVFTAKDLDERMIDVLSAVQQSLGLVHCQVLYQSHEESLYYYILYQPEELWRQNVIAADYDFGTLTIYDMKMNRSTRPVVVTVDKEHFDDLALADASLPSDPTQVAQLDEQLHYLMKKVMDQRIVSSVFLLGTGFRAQWMKKTLKYLCTGRRVFQGNNLFSKGASIAARERMNPGEMATRYLLLQNDKVRYNVGMRLQKAGTEVYQALLDAGTSWYDAGKTLNILLDRGNEIEFETVPVTGGRPKLVLMTLDNLPAREPRTTRLMLKLDMTSATALRIYVEDQGFGELIPASGKSWTKDIDLAAQA